MKKIVLWFCVVLMLAFGMSSCSSGDDRVMGTGQTSPDVSDNNKDKVLTQDQAWQIVKEKILHNELDDISVYVSKEYVKPNTAIQANYHTYLSPGYTSWVFFIDDVPFGNWSHPCRYAYVNVENGKYDVFDGTWPPSSLEKDFKLLVQPPF